MIPIRRILSSVYNKYAIEQVCQICRENFSEIGDYANKIPLLLDEPFSHGYSTKLLAGERGLKKIVGFSLILHLPEIRSSFLDFIVVSRSIRGGGIGSSFYEGTRELCKSIKSKGLYIEVLPDDPAVVTNPEILAENRKCMRFYENYGVCPVIGTEYETPIGDSAAPYLLFDGLGRKTPLGRKEAKMAVRLILERKYKHIVRPGYIDKVVKSFKDDPVKFRGSRYVIVKEEKKEIAPKRLKNSFSLVAVKDYDIHHIKDRGYVERPARVKVLLESLAVTGLFHSISPRHAGESLIRSVHDKDFVAYIKRACKKLGVARPVYPYVSPIRRPEKKPKEMAMRAGYYCIDTFAPLYPQAYEAARHAVDVAVTAAEEIINGSCVSYALCRPPGHHAERKVFGGFCYFNNAATAADYLSRYGRVAVLDIDYHHGNGTQDIFYRRRDVFFCSIHGHPNFAYPYFSGFKDEIGEAEGEGFNLNFPLPEDADEKFYLNTFDKAIDRISKFKPTCLVISLGFDIIRGDPTGTFSISPSSMEMMGKKAASLKLPILVVQEGGYTLRNLRRGAHSFFRGIADAVLLQ